MDSRTNPLAWLAMTIVGLLGGLSIAGPAMAQDSAQFTYQVNHSVFGDIDRLAIRIDFDCAFTNTVPVDAIRGAGKPEALFLLERLVDLAAHETGRSPVELRRLNLLKREDMPYAAASGYTYDAAGTYTVTLGRGTAFQDEVTAPAVIQ